MCRKFCIRLLVLGAATHWFAAGPFCHAADIESFEFNDATGTQLGSAANSAHPGNNWVVDPDMVPSQVAQNVDGRPGSYYILKTAAGSDNNFLQIDDITSGTRYLTAKIAGWDFEEAEQEQFRLAFVNGDTEPLSSNVITAQVSLVRGTDGTVELTGGALGTGSAPITSDVTFPAVHTGAFEMTLALDRTANKYKVFYRDEGGPTQVLGTGYIDPTRDGKAIRMQATGNYANFVSAFPGSYGDDYIDFFALDRVALTDTNPHTDLITLEIDRTNGVMTLRNTSGSAINGIESYSIDSASGGINPANWTPIAGGTNTSSNGELMQTFAAPINLANSQSIPLSNASGAWLKSPQEDLTMVLNLTGGATRTVNVSFINNGGTRFLEGDFNFDNAITVADYQYLVGFAESDLSGLSPTEAYRLGDLNGDNANNIRDFAAFKDLYNAANSGAGAFEAMLAAIPEPNAAMLAGFALLSSVAVRRRPSICRVGSAKARFDIDKLHCKLGDTTMRLASRCFLSLCLVAVVAWTGVRSAEATVLEDFTFGEPDGTVLGDAENSAHSGNSWTVSANTVESAMLDGKFRIQKQSVTGLASNYIDIENITSTSVTKKAWLVAEISGWNFTATAAGEDVRFAFLNNDTVPPSGSTITAQMRIFRSGDALALEGTALGPTMTNATNIGTTKTLPLAQTNPLTIVLGLDKTVNQYSVYYKDGNNPFALLGTAENDTGRNGNSIRFGFTGTFGDVGEFFDVDRIYMTDSNPITDVVAPVTLSLIVNTVTRDISIKNESDDAISFDSYRVTSDTGSLSFGEWASLSDRNPPLTPFDGPDGGTTPGDSPGELWTKAGGSNDSAVSESFLLSNTTLSPDDALNLGKLFKSGGTQDLLFQYHDAVSGAFYTIEPTYVTSASVPGDYNQDGTVNAADYTIWRDTLGSTSDLRANGDNTGASANKIDLADYAFWKAHFGEHNGSGAGGLASDVVPEPASVLLLLMGLLPVLLYAAVRVRNPSIHGANRPPEALLCR